MAGLFFSKKNRDLWTKWPSPEKNTNVAHLNTPQGYNHIGELTSDVIKDEANCRVITNIDKTPLSSDINSWRYNSNFKDNSVNKDHHSNTCTCGSNQASNTCTCGSNQSSKVSEHAVSVGGTDCNSNIGVMYKSNNLVCWTNLFNTEKPPTGL